MSTEIEGALIAFAGVVVSSVVSYFIAIGVSRQSQKKLYADLVSERRNVWLKEMRSYLSQLLAEARKTGDGIKPKEYYEAQYQVFLRLNPNEYKHMKLKKLIEKAEEKEMEKETEQEIIKISSSILKEEWERVKEESQK